MVERRPEANRCFFNQKSSCSDTFTSTNWHCFTEFLSLTNAKSETLSLISWLLAFFLLFKINLLWVKIFLREKFVRKFYKPWLYKHLWATRGTWNTIYLTVSVCSIDCHNLHNCKFVFGSVRTLNVRMRFDKVIVVSLNENVFFRIEFNRTIFSVNFFTMNLMPIQH